MANISGTANPDILTGTALADLIEGLASDDVLYGFDSNDTLIGGSGDDILYGGSGDDTMDGGAGEDLLYGQSGNDTVTYASALAALTLNLTDASLSTGDAVGDWFLSVENFILGSFNDTFIGNDFGNMVGGGAGNDLLRGLGGADILQGGAGDDTLIGGAGADSLVGGTGTNLASYADSTAGITLSVVDMVHATGDAAGDSFAGIARLAMTGLADMVTLGGPILWVDGGAGQDTLLGAGSNDTLVGGAENDDLRGNGGSDLLFGDQGDDGLFGDDGADQLFGGIGTDTLMGGAGADFLDGGADIDSLSYTLKVRLDLTNPGLGKGDAKGDVLTDIEIVNFAGTGSVFVGGATDILVVSMGAAMTCIAGSGAETFRNTNNIGQMTVSYQNAASSVSLTGGDIGLAGTGAAIGDVIFGATTLVLTAFSDELNFTRLSGATPLSSIDAGTGKDKITMIESVVGLIDLGGGNDSATGGVGQGNIFGGAGNDVVDIYAFGNLGDDDASLFGGAGDDVLTLSSYRSNWIEGGDGNDTMVVVGSGIEGGMLLGGSGDDSITATGFSFQIDAGTGNDVIDVTAVHLPASFLVIEAGDGDDQITVTAGLVGEVTEPFGISIEGGAGQDVITGIDGGALIHERFVFVAPSFVSGWGADQVIHFDLATDMIVIDAAAAGITSIDDLSIQGDATHTFIGNGSNLIELVGIDVALFGAEHIEFL